MQTLRERGFGVKAIIAKRMEVNHCQCIYRAGSAVQRQPGNGCFISCNKLCFNPFFVIKQ